MSRFLTALNLVEATVDVDNGQWLLGSALVYESDHLNRTVTVPVGFQTDLASVPRLPVVYLLAGDCAREAAVVHDYLYGGVDGVSRKDADAVLYEASQASGVPRWRSWLMWAGVRVGGASHFTAQPAQ